ncbi:MAG: histidine kinase [Nitrospirae bacterium]|nr:histidine kinase [Nitrospirota bacterium]
MAPTHSQGLHHATTKGAFQLMKDRREFRVIDGFRQYSGKQPRQREALTQGISRNEGLSRSCLLHEQNESDIASALKASEQRLSDLLHDRSRIGRELHDSVWQALDAIRMSLEQTLRLQQDMPRTAQLPCDQAANQVNRLIQDIRRMILAVEADNIEPFSLASELRFLSQTFERVGELRIRLEIDQEAEEILTGEEARELVTITREALSNCVRHANATRIVIALRKIGSRVRLSIRDNGAGFNVEQEQAKGIGFAHMEDRVRKIGGRLNIRSTVGRGTCITTDIYLKPRLTTI